jgi:hypothetical protein
MIDSAAYGYPTCQGASINAREAIKELFEKDLLVLHRAKSLTSDLVEKADLILVIEDGMKES